MINPSQKFETKLDVKFETKNTGKTYVTDSKLVYFQKHYREIFVDDYIEEKGEGCLIKGIAGSGKSKTLCEVVMSAKIQLYFKISRIKQ